MSPTTLGLLGVAGGACLFVTALAPGAGAPALGQATLRAGACIFRADLAIRPEDQARGMSGRASVPGDYALVFPLDPARSTDFWMRGTAAPLSIAFVDVDGVVLRQRDLTPFSNETASSGLGVAFAFEVRQGELERCRIRRGTRVQVPDSLKMGDPAHD